MKRFLLFSFMLSILFSGCTKGPDDNDEYTSLEQARDGLNDLMKVMYFWRENIPSSIDADDYEGPEDFLEAIRYTPKDKWSFVADFDDFMASMEGDFVGHGIRLALDDNDEVRVLSLYKNSDLWPKGVRRGWIVLELNGEELAPIFIENNATKYNTLMGPAVAGRTNTFLFKKPDGNTVLLSSTKSSFTINSVTADTVFDRPGGKIAYLCFETFIDPSEGELNEAFADFKAKGATDLVIDLRYNGGGYMDIALQLASLVVDGSYTNKVCYKLNYNSYVSAQWNKSANFNNQVSSLGLDRVVFITSEESASASEVVINSLKAWIDVSIVGETTHGKPAGMNVWGYPFYSGTGPEPDYTYVFAPITFEYVNALNEGAFYNGMTPDVAANDDITHDFGDTEELSLKAALAILEGTKAAPSEPSERRIIFSEGTRPEHLFLRPQKGFQK